MNNNTLAMLSAFKNTVERAFFVSELTKVTDDLRKQRDSLDMPDKELDAKIAYLAIFTSMI